MDGRLASILFPLVLITAFQKGLSILPDQYRPGKLDVGQVQYPVVDGLAQTFLYNLGGVFGRTNFFFAFGSCCSSETASPCSAKKMSCEMGGESDEDKGCCEDKPSFHILEQNQKTEETKLKNIEESKIPKISKDYRGYIFPNIDVHSTTHFSYSPPVMITDPQVWFEVFLC